MKKILYIVTLALAFSACSKMMDEVAPKGQISTDKLTEKDLSLLTNGTLHQYEAFLSNVWTEGDYLAENFGSGPGFSYPDPHGETQSASASIPLSRWQYCYGKLNYANLLIKSALAAANQESSDVKTALGTGYLFRAMIYSALVQRYGGVPIIKTSGSLEIVPRSSEEEVWAMILEDLDLAEGYLSEFHSFAYPSKEACWVLRSKVCLWIGEYEEAEVYADKVVGSGKFVLGSTSEDFASMFVNGTSSREIIFAPINIRSSSYIRIYEKMNDTDGSYNYSPSSWCYSNLFADNTYAEGDIRLRPTFSDSDSRPIIKFPNGQDGQFIANPDPSQSPIMCWRLADAYLLKAEAQWAQGHNSEAAATLESFMKYRYAKVTVPSTLDKDAVEALILDENRREFYAEGHRWFDVKRIGLNHHSDDFSDWIETQYSEWDGRDFLIYWPIPQVERDKSAGVYTQNAGYSGAEE